MKKIKLTFVEENVSCIAELREDKAPQTAQLIWDILETPMENKAIHAMYTGRELSFGVPTDRADEARVFAPYMISVSSTAPRPVSCCPPAGVPATTLAISWKIWMSLQPSAPAARAKASS